MLTHRVEGSFIIQEKSPCRVEGEGKWNDYIGKKGIQDTQEWEEFLHFHVPDGGGMGLGC